MSQKIISTFLSGNIIQTGPNPRCEGVFLGPRFCFKGEYTYYKLYDCVYIHQNGNIIDSVCYKPPLSVDVP